jgi:glutaminyl-peptide cyclotransferase
MMMTRPGSGYLLLGVVAIALTGCGGSSAPLSNPALHPPASVDTVPGAVSVPATRPPQRRPAMVVATYPHDAGAFTEGLIWADDGLYESVGLTGGSAVRREALDTGGVAASVPLPADEFGEGLARVGDRLITLTWTSGVAHVYDRATLAPITTFTYPGEGWGLTFDGRRLIMSDGTTELRMIDPVTFAELDRITVTAGGAPVDMLNELEYVDGLIYANVWKSPDIAVIDPTSGVVRSWIDTTALRPADTLGDVDAVANGIAYDAVGDRLFVTGKRWSALYQIERVEPA